MHSLIFATATEAIPLNTVAIATLASFFVPLLVSFITKQSASDGLRAVLNIIGVALISVITLWVNASTQPVGWALAINTFILSLVTSVSAYKGLWKPTGITGSITAATPNLGLGSPPLLETASKGAEDMGQVDNDPKENA